MELSVIMKNLKPFVAVLPVVILIISLAPKPTTATSQDNSEGKKVKDLRQARKKMANYIVVNIKPVHLFCNMASLMNGLNCFFTLENGFREGLPVVC